MQQTDQRPSLEPERLQLASGPLEYLWRAARRYRLDTQGNLPVAPVVVPTFETLWQGVRGLVLAVCDCVTRGRPPSAWLLTSTLSLMVHMEMDVCVHPTEAVAAGDPVFDAGQYATVLQATLQQADALAHRFGHVSPASADPHADARHRWAAAATWLQLYRPDLVRVQLSLVNPRAAALFCLPWHDDAHFLAHGGFAADLAAVWHPHTTREHGLVPNKWAQVLQSQVINLVASFTLGVVPVTGLVGFPESAATGLPLVVNTACAALVHFVRRTTPAQNVRDALALIRTPQFAGLDGGVQLEIRRCLHPDAVTANAFWDNEGAEMLRAIQAAAARHAAIAVASGVGPLPETRLSRADPAPPPAADVLAFDVAAFFQQRNPSLETCAKAVQVLRWGRAAVPTVVWDTYFLDMLLRLGRTSQDLKWHMASWQCRVYEWLSGLLVLPVLPAVLPPMPPLQCDPLVVAASLTRTWDLLCALVPNTKTGFHGAMPTVLAALPQYVVMAMESSGSVDAVHTMFMKAATTVPAILGLLKATWTSVNNSAWFFMHAVLPALEGIVATQPPNGVPTAQDLTDVMVTLSSAGVLAWFREPANQADIDADNLRHRRMALVNGCEDRVRHAGAGILTAFAHQLACLRKNKKPSNATYATLHTLCNPWKVCPGLAEYAHYMGFVPTAAFAGLPCLAHFFLMAQDVSNRFLLRSPDAYKGHDIRGTVIRSYRALLYASQLRDFRASVIPLFTWTSLTTVVHVMSIVLMYDTLALLHPAKIVDATVLTSVMTYALHAQDALIPYLRPVGAVAVAMQEPEEVGTSVPPADVTGQWVRLASPRFKADLLPALCRAFEQAEQDQRPRVPRGHSEADLAAQLRYPLPPGTKRLRTRRSEKVFHEGSMEPYAVFEPALRVKHPEGQSLGFFRNFTTGLQSFFPWGLGHAATRGSPTMPEDLVRFTAGLLVQTGPTCYLAAALNVFLGSAILQELLVRCLAEAHQAAPAVFERMAGPIVPGQPLFAAPTLRPVPAVVTVGRKRGRAPPPPQVTTSATYEAEHMGFLMTVFVVFLRMLCRKEPHTDAVMSVSHLLQSLARHDSPDDVGGVAETIIVEILGACGCTCAVVPEGQGPAPGFDFCLATATKGLHTTMHSTSPPVAMDRGAFLAIGGVLGVKLPPPHGQHYYTCLQVPAEGTRVVRDPSHQHLWPFDWLTKPIQDLARFVDAGTEVVCRSTLYIRRDVAALIRCDGRRGRCFAQTVWQRILDAPPVAI